MAAELALGGPPASFLDLGSGGGVPGLVLACRWPGQVTLLDANKRRTSFLAEGVSDLGLADRVRIVWGRAEDAGRDASLRAAFDLVVARSFGPPGVTAECAAPLLRPEGVLIVSEPPDPAPERWPVPGLTELGLVAVGVMPDLPVHLQVLRAVSPCPDRYPRRTGIPSKRPLF
jgi:16S rRNA (guanine527-N7)-methyltransferase